jgi:hypothetical protein
LRVAARQLLQLFNKQNLDGFGYNTSDHRSFVGKAGASAGRVVDFQTRPNFPGDYTQTVGWNMKQTFRPA